MDSTSSWDLNTQEFLRKIQQYWDNIYLLSQLASWESTRIKQISLACSLSLVVIKI